VVEESGGNQNRKDDDEGAKIVPVPLAQIPASSPKTPSIEARVFPEQPVSQVDDKATDQDKQNALQVGEKPVSNFERKIAIIGIGLAAITAVLFYVQLKEMASQTRILASQNESAAAGGLFDQMNTRTQLGIAQKQAKAAQDSVDAIQKQTTIARRLAQEDRRPWVGAKDFECGKCTTTPKETNPNDARTPITVEDLLMGDLSILLENSGRTPALKMNYSSFFGIVRTKSDPVPDYDSLLAERTPKSIPDKYAKEVEIVQKFTGLISTVLAPNSSRRLRMPEQMMQERRLNVPIPQQTITYVVGRVTYYGPEMKAQFVTNFCLMNEKGVEFLFCPSGNDMK
jgi:hypothetical protein